VIEIGCVEILNRRPSGQKFQRYLNPERDIDAGALAVHGIELTKLAAAPKFAAICAELIAFIEGAELIIHNAPFDVGFLDAEFARLPGEARTISSCAACSIRSPLRAACIRAAQQPRCPVQALQRRQHQRELHGALLDAGILVDVYLAMTGGQGTFALDVNAAEAAAARASANKSRCATGCGARGAGAER